MSEKIERQKWKEELKKEIREKKKKPNGFQWFTLGFCTCTLFVEIIMMIKG